MPKSGRSTGSVRGRRTKRCIPNGKCPLELAGYDVSTVPMAQICRGQVLDWPPEGLGEVVPKR